MCLKTDKNRVSERQLVEFVTDVSKKLDEGKETGVCIQEFLFHKVNHDRHSSPNYRIEVYDIKYVPGSRIFCVTDLSRLS